MATPISDKIASETPYTGPADATAGAVEGVNCRDAASVDAMCVALGNPSPYPGACLALGWSGETGSPEFSYVFKDGELIAKVPRVGNVDTVALMNSYGIDTDHQGRILRLVAA